MPHGDRRPHHRNARLPLGATPVLKPARRRRSRGAAGYVLNGGLLEITYNTGAKVIVEGPAVYAADGCNWDFLLGRLTVAGRQERRPEWETARRPENHGGRPPWPAAFAVQTPTSMLLDNGDHEAEFGVEVDEAGTSYARTSSADW